MQMFTKCHDKNINYINARTANLINSIIYLTVKTLQKNFFNLSRMKKPMLIKHLDDVFFESILYTIIYIFWKH